MDWKLLLSYMTGSVDQELRLGNEYLMTENRILRKQLQCRVRLSDGELKRLAEWGVLSSGQYLIHDRDGKYCPAFQQIIDEAGVQRVSLSPRSPDLNAYAERWVRSVKEEALSRLLLLGERLLRYALSEYVSHYHQDRPHQGKGNVVLTPAADYRQQRDGSIHCHERLGGLLKCYYREAA